MKPSSGAGPPPAERGVALIIVLFFLLILSGIVLAFFSSVTTESASASNYTAGVSTKMLSDVVVNLVEAQIQDGTQSHSASGATGSMISWASQPGMIRTFDTTGNPLNFYKLYSADSLVVPAANFTADLESLPGDWTGVTYTDLYTDLNAPAADADGDFIYPIVDPSQIDKKLIAGFALNNPPGYKPNSPGTTLAQVTANNRAPMPVKWLYLLQDGTFVAATSAGSGDSGTVTVAGATTANPIVGRVAFWTDDESAKVNINTASEGVYWDTPRIYSFEDYGQHSGTGSGIATIGLSLCQPAQHEFQGYPGHPATTSLGPILGSFLPVPTPPTAISTTNATQLDAYDKIAPRVMPGGSEGGTQTPGGPLAIKQDRLYASVDELIFSSIFSSNLRIPNAVTGNTPTPGAINRQALEQVKFFLTANSNAPETTLFNTPRISMWPINANATLQTAYDKLAGFCTTIGNQSYTFTRSNPRSSTADFTSRNQALYKYLQTLTSNPIPGFGGDFKSKYSTDRDQILTFIYDYIRCTSTQDRSNGATPYTPVFIDQATPGAGEILPIKINNTQGFGRFYSIAEADLMFWGTGTGSTATGLNAALLLEFATPLQGLGCVRNSCAYTVTGLDKFQVQFGGKGSAPLGFRPGGTNYIDWADLDSYHGRSLGGSEGPIQAFVTTGNTPKPFNPGSTVHNQYPFCTPPGTPVTIPSGVSSFTLLAPSPIIIQIASSDTNQLIQTLTIQFPPSGTFKIPTVGSPVIDTGNPQNLVPPQATVVGMEVAGGKGNSPQPATDGTAGDTRMVEGLAVVPLSRFRAHQNYTMLNTQYAYGLLPAVGENYYPGGTNGKLANVTSYVQYDITRQPHVPSRAATGVYRADGGPGDWDTGVGDQKDGAYINKPDEGDSALTDVQNGAFRLPYLFGYDHGFASATQTFFSPNRQVPSAMMLGSIPTGVQRDLPWQTLCFSPKPEDPTHPGLQSPKDHLIADLFWMPVIEPYAISQPFSTTGKVNLNYQIQPFTYIERSTGLRAVLQSTKFAALPLSDSTTYKPLDPGGGPTNRNPNRRNFIDLDQTIAAFDTLFSKNQIFRSASQICEMNLVPVGTNAQNMASFWFSNPLTGDNLREKPYADIYPRLTTKSNTFTVHLRVQALRKSRSTPPAQWVRNQDQVMGEYRGSAIIERYIDPNDPTLPDFASLAASSLSSPQLNIDQYYKLRVISTKRFFPD